MHHHLPALCPECQVLPDSKRTFYATSDTTERDLNEFAYYYRLSTASVRGAAFHLMAAGVEGYHLNPRWQNLDAAGGYVSLDKFKGNVSLDKFKGKVSVIMAGSHDVG